MADLDISSILLHFAIRIIIHQGHKGTRKDLTFGQIGHGKYCRKGGRKRKGVKFCPSWGFILPCDLQYYLLHHDQKVSKGNPTTSLRDLRVLLHIFVFHERSREPESYALRKHFIYCKWGPSRGVNPSTKIFRNLRRRQRKNRPFLRVF